MLPSSSSFSPAPGPALGRASLIATGVHRSSLQAWKTS
jgi:hypothetical protein